MKHFVVEIVYAAALDSIDAALPAHRAFLQAGYDRGWLLMSGPCAPRIAGIVVARAPSRESLEDFFRADPFLLQGLAKYRYTEFSPVKHQNFMAVWCGGDDSPKAA